MSKGVRGIAFAVVIFGALSACTAQTVVDPTSVSSVVPSTSRGAQLTETTTSTTATAPTSSSITSAATESTVESTVAAVSNPWPADFTPDQEAMAQSALAVVPQYAAALDVARQDPTNTSHQDEIRKYTASPELASVLDNLTTLTENKIHQVGTVTYSDLQVLSIQGPQVTLQACIDASAQSYVFEDGTVVDRDPVARALATLNASDYGTEYGWLVENSETVQPVTPC